MGLIVFQNVVHRNPIDLVLRRFLPLALVCVDNIGKLPLLLLGESDKQNLFAGNLNRLSDSLNEFISTSC
jgi:hypothetical protein